MHPLLTPLVLDSVHAVVHGLVFRAARDHRSRPSPSSWASRCWPRAGTAGRGGAMSSVRRRLLPQRVRRAPRACSSARAALNVGHRTAQAQRPVGAAPAGSVTTRAGRRECWSLPGRARKPRRSPGVRRIEGRPHHRDGHPAQGEVASGASCARTTPSRRNTLRARGDWDWLAPHGQECTPARMPRHLDRLRALGASGVGVSYDFTADPVPQRLDGLDVAFVPDEALGQRDPRRGGA